MRFIIKDTNLFLLPNNPHMLHLATIGYGLREFIVFTCIKGTYKGSTYIEECVLTNVDFSKDVYAHCKFIEDDNLAFDLAKFCEDKKITDIPSRLNSLIDQGKDILIRDLV